MKKGLHRLKSKITADKDFGYKIVAFYDVAYKKEKLVITVDPTSKNVEAHVQEDFEKNYIAEEDAQEAIKQKAINAKNKSNTK